MSRTSPFGLFQQQFVAVDRFSKLIEPGHIVLLSAPTGLTFEVVDVRPVLNPDVPQGKTVVQVMLVAKFPVQLLAGEPSQNLVVVGETEARMKAKTVDA